jgi:hypothetical protein
MATCLLIGASGLLLASVAMGQPAGRAFLRASEVWVQTQESGSPRQLTDDGRKKGLLTQPKSGTLLAFVSESSPTSFWTYNTTSCVYQ